MEFWTRYDIESGWDNGYVEVSADGGPWTTLGSVTGSQSSWAEQEFWLAGYEGQDVRVRFRLDTDRSVTRDGWYIDDVSIGAGDTKTQAKSAIDGITAGGMTSIGAGIRAADQELDRFPNDPAQAMLVMTDGHHNRSPHPYDVIDTDVDDEIAIYTIGFGAGADAGLLGEIADRRNGAYYYAPSRDELRQIYSSLAGELTGQQTLFSVSDVIQQAQQVVHTGLIDASVRVARFILDWGGSDLDLGLVAPDGTSIDHESAAESLKLSFTSGETYEMYTVDSPLPGEWQMVADAVDIPSGGETYNASITGATAVGMSMSTDRSTYETGELVRIEAAVEDGSPITGASVTATIDAPSDAGFDVDSLQLYDDGAHGDGAADDGVYANDFRRIAWPGSYTIRVNAEGTSNLGIPFTRTDFQSIAVSAGADSDGDGIPDVWEDREGTDRSVNDAHEDLEPDLLTNLQEYFAGTRPSVFDTDGDGFADGIEVTEGADPLHSDSVPSLATPAVYLVGPSMIDEGGTFTGTVLFADPDADTWTVSLDFGDGASLEEYTITQQSVPFTHTYADDGDYTVTATVEAGGGGAATLGVTVNNVAPVIANAQLDATAIDVNETVALTGSFDDPGTLDGHEAVVEWGDGETDTLDLPVGERSFSASHQYSGDSPSGEDLYEFMINVTVTDDDGGSGTTTAPSIAGPNAFGYYAYDHAFESVDLAAGEPAVFVVLDGYDDGSASLDLAGNTFNYYGTSYTTVLFPNSNGLFTFDDGTIQYSNTNLSSSPSQAAVAPLFDDWRTDRGGGDAVLARFDDVDGDGTSDRLVIEWNNVQHYSSSPSGVTFQAIVELNTGDTPGDITFNYPDLDAGTSSYNDGASATVGIKDSNAAGSDPLLVSCNGPAPDLGSGESILISTTPRSDLTVTVDFTAPAPPALPALTDFDVQKGAAQRSYIRHLDLIFEESEGLDDLVGDSRTQLTRYELDGSGGNAVDLSDILTTVNNRIEFDFGAQGIGGDGTPNGEQGITVPSTDTLLIRLEVTAATSAPPAVGDTFTISVPESSLSTYFYDPGFSELSYSSSTGTVTMVPEASAMLTWLFLGGLGLGTFSLRRRYR